MYVVGYEKNTKGTFMVRLWKNGVVQDFTDGTCDAIANSVHVSGNDVYVVGYEGNVARLWINGTAKDLTDGTYEAKALSVFVK